MMNESDKHPSPHSVAGASGNDDLTSSLWTKDQREQRVLVVPDSMKTAPVDIGWIAENDPFGCEVIVLGRPMAHERYETSVAEYRGVLVKMIASGIRVIHKGLLNETNAKYLELHPNAEGVHIRRVKPRETGGAEQPENAKGECKGVGRMHRGRESLPELKDDERGGKAD